MCYKYATPNVADLTEMVTGFEIYQGYEEHFFVDGFDLPRLPITTNTEPCKIVSGRWGLIPEEKMPQPAADEVARMTLNAKSETIFEARSYKRFIGVNHCLIWASGFYESKWMDAKGNEKHPHLIYSGDRKPFTMGGIFANWIDPETGELIPTFSIITTPANELLLDIHNNPKNPGRMPFILNPEDRNRWLQAKAKDEIISLMQPLSNGILTAHKVSKAVNARSGNKNIPEIQLPYEYPGLW